MQQVGHHVISYDTATFVRCCSAKDTQRHFLSWLSLARAWPMQRTDSHLPPKWIAPEFEIKCQIAPGTVMFPPPASSIARPTKSNRVTSIRFSSFNTWCIIHHVSFIPLGFWLIILYPVNSSICFGDGFGRANLHYYPTPFSTAGCSKQKGLLFSACGGATFGALLGPRRLSLDWPSCRRLRRFTQGLVQLTVTMAVWGGVRKEIRKVGKKKRKKPKMGIPLLFCGCQGVYSYSGMRFVHIFCIFAIFCQSTPARSLDALVSQRQRGTVHIAFSYCTTFRHNSHCMTSANAIACLVWFLTSLLVGVCSIMRESTTLIVYITM